MHILPGSPMTQYIAAVELDGKPINATYIDMETGRVQYWHAGEQVEAHGEVKVLLQAKQKVETLDPAMAVELDRLLEEAKQGLAIMEANDRTEVYANLKSLLAAALED